MLGYFFEASLQVSLEQVVDLFYFRVVDHVLEVFVGNLDLVLVLIGEEILEFEALVSDECFQFFSELLLEGQEFWMQFFLFDGVDAVVDDFEVAIVVLLSDLPHQFNYKFAD